MFGDNKSIVDSSMTRNGKMHYRHIALSFNRIRESIATEIVNYQFIDGSINLVDVLSKHWAHSDIWTTLKSILFWIGDAMDCFNNNTLE